MWHPAQCSAACTHACSMEYVHGLLPVQLGWRQHSPCSKRSSNLDCRQSVADAASPMSPLQVWNVNHCGGVVGVFNIQGATWSRQRHAFVTHDATPAVLEAIVRPQDAAPLAGQRFWQEESSHSMACRQTADMRKLADAPWLQLCARPAACGLIPSDVKANPVLCRAGAASKGRGCRAHGRPVCAVQRPQRAPSGAALWVQLTACF